MFELDEPYVGKEGAGPEDYEAHCEIVVDQFLRLGQHRLHPEMDGRRRRAHAGQRESFDVR